MVLAAVGDSPVSVTVIVSSTEPSRSTSSSSSCSPPSSENRRNSLSKPGFPTTRLYSAGSSSANSKRPAASPVTRSCSAVARLVSVRPGFCTTCPAWSTTVPAMRAVCAATCRPAATIEASTIKARLEKRAKRVSGRRLVWEFNMADNLRSRCDGRAIAGAGNHVRRCFRASFTSSTSCVAQVVAATPCASTRSSAACSLSRRSRARTTHTSGLNHQTQRNVSAAICHSQSQRRAWASSCSSTTRIRSADHAAADAGSMTAGRRQPHVATSPGRGPNSRSTPRLTPHDRARSLHSRCHGPSVTRRDETRSQRSLANPTRSTPALATTPASQIVTAQRPMASPVVTAAAAGPNRPGWERAGSDPTASPL